MEDNMETSEEPSTKDDQPMDPCERHKQIEMNLLKASAERKFTQDVQSYKTTKRLNEEDIPKHQKELADLNILMTHMEGELASFYPCPNPNCHAFNRTFVSTPPTDGVFTGDTTNGHEHIKPTNMKENHTRKNSKKQSTKDGFTSPSKTKKLKLTDHPKVKTEYPIQLSNKFDALAPSDAEPPITAQQPILSKKIPPIMLKYKSTYATLAAHLLQKYPDSTFKLAGEFLKIFTTNPDPYQAITNYLTEKGQQYYDSPPPLPSLLP
ncbi:hypothetical protein TNCT_484701 [Trichonephila clavata]|uniref:Uncharacterized protein n=1 Tax=Trichonephila clavata TaxID=2740835 RepID=A0A8X6JMC4_TRICU|nr:hypothetical protein TNCT_484701 [Trichonephila clavata]